MDYADNNCEFHLEAVLNRENVICVEEPSWVESERIYALFAIILIEGRVVILGSGIGEGRVFEALKWLTVDGDEVKCSTCGDVW